MEIRFVEGYRGVPAVVLDSGALTAAVLPTVGGKVASIRDHEWDREILVQPRGEYAAPTYGSRFKDFDCSGFDDCFPSIDPCTVLLGVRSVDIPELGELWTATWSATPSPQGIRLRFDSPTLPYRMTKSIELRDRSLQVSYSVENTGDTVLPYLWSAHALLRVEPGDRLYLPPGIHNLHIGFSQDGALGPPGDRCDWPISRRRGKPSRRGEPSRRDEPSRRGEPSLALDTLDSGEPRFDKLFALRVPEGWCRLQNDATGRFTCVRWDASANPYLGIWRNASGWPLDDPGRRFACYGVEPCSSFPDSLAAAIENGSARRLAPGEVHSWSLRVEVG